MELAKDILQMIEHAQNNIDNGGTVSQYVRLVENIKNLCIAERLTHKIDELKWSFYRLNAIVVKKLLTLKLNAASVIPTTDKAKKLFFVVIVVG